MTEEMGKRVRASVLGAVAGAGIARVVISGLANEYLSYFTTPEEYDRQHYEGGSMLYGRTSSEVLKAALTDLATTLVQGKPAPTPYPYDPRNGLAPASGPFPQGADHANAMTEPATTVRLARAQFSWQGGPKGDDRPLDGAFVTIRQRLKRGRWKPVDSDLGLRMLWTVDSSGVYTDQWEVPLGAKPGLYKFLVTANHYRLESKPFRVIPASTLTLKPAPAGPGRMGVILAYPPAVVERDLTARPQLASAGRVTFIVAGRRVVVRRARAGVFALRVPSSGSVSVAAGGARDRFGTRNGNALTLRP
jgi:hypothetical protein